MLDRGIAIPIAVTGIGGTLLAGISAMFFRREGAMFYLLLAVCGCCLIASVVTVVVHLPINARIATWNPADLPANDAEFPDRWWQWQKVRLATNLAGMMLLFVAVLIRK